MIGLVLNNRTFGLVMACLLLASCGCMNLPSHKEPPVPYPPPGVVPTELTKVAPPPYVVEPPDLLFLEVSLPPKDVFSPAISLWPQPVSGQHLVRYDGTISLGYWGSVVVEGLTLEQATDAVRKHLYHRIQNDPLTKGRIVLDGSVQGGKAKGKENADKAPPEPDNLSGPEKLLITMDVLAYNSKKFYVFLDGAGNGEQIFEFICTGRETVLDALAKVGGVPPVGSKRKIWVARRTPNPDMPHQILPVDYVATSQQGLTLTNYQLFPGDRVYVHSQKIFRVNNFLDKALTPIDRMLGITLLGSSTVNSISGRGLNTGGIR